PRSRRIAYSAGKRWTEDKRQRTGQAAWRTGLAPGPGPGRSIPPRCCPAASCPLFTAHCPLIRGRAAGELLGRHPLEPLVDQPVVAGLLGSHEFVPVGILLDLLERLTGVFLEQVVEPSLDLADVLPPDLDLRGRPAVAAERLVDHHLGVGQ